MFDLGATIEKLKATQTRLQNEMLIDVEAKFMESTAKFKI